MLLPELDFIIH
ncbi:unnamed protein product, partial [Allacma fusca]